MPSRSPEEFVVGLYRLLLARDPEPGALADGVARLESGAVSRAGLAFELVSSPEFARVRALDDAVARGLEARLGDERPRELTAPPGSDERPVEIAWTLARYRGEARVLDVGYAHAERAYLEALKAAAPQAPTGVDLVAAEVPGIEGVQADVRRLPFERGSFDVIFCISTLEHVGKDNSLYGVEAERDAGGITHALRELKRVLRRGGRVLITVPAGENEDREWFVQRDPRSWRELFLQAGFAVHEHELYELFDDGWRSVEQVSEGLRYGMRGPGASAVLCAELRPGRLNRIRQRVRVSLRRGPGG
jgi:O-antigen chain-terminating methyltransferase